MSAAAFFRALNVSDSEGERQILNDISPTWFPLDSHRNLNELVSNYFVERLKICCPPVEPNIKMLIIYIATQSGKKDEYLQVINSLTTNARTELFNALEVLSISLKPVNEQQLTDPIATQQVITLGTNFLQNHKVSVAPPAVERTLNVDLNEGVTDTKKLMIHWQEYSRMSDRVHCAEMLMEKYKGKAEKAQKLERTVKQLEKRLMETSHVDKMAVQLLKEENEQLRKENEELKKVLDSKNNLSNINKVVQQEEMDSNFVAGQEKFEKLQEAYQKERQLFTSAWRDLRIHYKRLAGTAKFQSWLAKQRQTVVFDESRRRSHLL